jgi:hypothetical protein
MSWLVHYCLGLLIQPSRRIRPQAVETVERRQINLNLEIQVADSESEATVTFGGTGPKTVLFGIPRSSGSAGSGRKPARPGPPNSFIGRSRRADPGPVQGGRRQRPAGGHGHVGLEGHRLGSEKQY